MRARKAVAAFALLHTASSLRLKSVYTAFFPQYVGLYNYLLHNDSLCGEAYKNFQNDDYGDRKTQVVINGYARIATGLLIDCLLEHTPESEKFRMAGAQVLLGLTPSLLALLGPSPWHTGAVASIGKRPLVAFFIAASSPALIPSLIDDNHLKDNFLHPLQYYIMPPWLGQSIRAGKSPRERLAIAVTWIIFYVLAIASMGNMIDVAFRIATQAPFSFAYDCGWLVFLWLFIGLSIHAMGAITFSLRVKHHPVVREEKREKRFRITIRPPKFATTCMNWLTAVCTVVHVFFGTLLFSSVLFVSVVDATAIILRLLASILFCRLAAELFNTVDRRNIQIVSEDSQVNNRQHNVDEGREAS